MPVASERGAIDACLGTRPQASAQCWESHPRSPGDVSFGRMRTRTTGQSSAHNVRVVWRNAIRSRSLGRSGDRVVSVRART